MIANLLRQRKNRRVIETLHGRLVAAARRPVLFLPPYEVPDTVEGRFDLLLLFGILLIGRLQALPAPGPEIAQELVDALFQHFDSDLREMGVGDLSVPKRMKTLAEAFAGRNAVYRDTLSRHDNGLPAALARNIYASAEPDRRAAALAAYCRRTVAALDRADLAQVLVNPPFPNPEAIHASARGA
jgi:cytochrome b pre-mRNA-processing protein 3